MFKLNLPDACGIAAARYICKEPDSSIIGKLIDDGRGHFMGECVSLLKHQCPALPPTIAWKQGVLVKGLVRLVKGAAIATFDANGKYKGHAAIYITQNAGGIEVWDQYNHPSKGVGKRTLSYKGIGLSNNGNNFYVVS